MDVFCLIQVRNDARYLQGFLRHIAPHVDGIVALDDCSTDATPEILCREPIVASILRETKNGPPHANEVTNRHRLLVEAARLGAAWVLCADADERFEERFLCRVRREAARGDRWGRPVRCVRVLNLWNSPDHYRVDGRCGPRYAPRMFRVPRAFSARKPGMHQPWLPPELDATPRVNMKANLYHLRMIEPGDRRARFRKFTAVDPDKRDQVIGYDHLVDETGLQVKPVPHGRGYTNLTGLAALGLPQVDRTAPVAGREAPRFHLEGGPGFGSPETSHRAWCRLTGFDFQAIFRTARAGGG